MPLYEAQMRVVHIETWSVEADDEAEAIEALNKISDAVETDETGGEVVDWEIQGRVKLVEADRIHD